MSGVLQGLKVIEIAGIGPAPFCAMMLADMGAEVIRVERANAPASGFEMPAACEFLNRGRRSIALDLKSADGAATLKRLAAKADILLEGYRPGAMERLGLGPDVLLAENPRLVYGRMTGFGQTGPLANAAGHDINYIALTGALEAIGHRDGPPVPPLNLVGDFGGGGMLLAVGLLAAYIEAQKSGKGQVVDAAMVDGATLLMAGVYAFRAAGFWKEQREANLVDGGAPWYGVYETADGRHVSLGSIEPRFYECFLDMAGIDRATLPKQHDTARWPELRNALADAFRRRTMAQWQELLEGSDACFAPILSMSEAPNHPHMKARDAFVEIGGQHTAEVLRDWEVT